MGLQSWIWLVSSCLIKAETGHFLISETVFSNYGVVLYDPSNRLEQSLFEADRDEIISLLVEFKHKMSGSHLGQWAVHSGIAVVEALSMRDLFTEANVLAQDLGFNDTVQGFGLLVVLSDLGVELAGSLLSPGHVTEVHFRESSEWLAAEDLCNEKLRSGRFSQAAQAAFDGILRVVTGSTVLTNPHITFKQKELAKWDSFGAFGEVWQNMCGDRLCRELVLGDVRQLSDAFERYYHEAMTFPALNLLGSAKKRKVLILGGGDGGVATCALQFATVEKVVNIDIDETVSRESLRWFPKVAAGFNNSRCELIHADAFQWVEETTDTFDLVVIDFTDEPLKGAWSEKFFQRLRGLMSSDGIIVQNVGTIGTPEDMQKIFRLHSSVFGSVFPMHALIPDYLGPYILVLSSLDPELALGDVDWTFWQRQRILTQYYDGPEEHMALFTAIPADVMHLLGLPLDKAPSKITLVPPFRSRRPAKEKAIFKERGHEGNEVKVALGTSYSLYQEWDAILSDDSWQRDECLLLPALSILNANSVLILGGGTGALASLALQWPSVQRVVVLEVDELVVESARKYFSTAGVAFSDPRTELIMEDAFQWISRTSRKFDLVVLSMFDQPWLAPRRTTRVPQVRPFYRQLRALIKPGGLLVQEAGSVGMPEAFGALLELHRQIFTQTWPLAMSSSTLAPTNPNDDFDGLYFRVPRLLLMSSRDDVDPTKVHWHQWQGFVQKRGVEKTTYYHPAMHRALFVLPVELQRRFRALPPWQTQAADDFLIQSFMMQAHGCSMLSLNDIHVAGDLLKKIAILAELTALGSLEHTFEPQGLTALLLVSESHLSIHTWPELQYAALDVVSCKAMPPRIRKAIEAEVEHSLRCQSLVSHFSLRGRGVDQVHPLEEVKPVTHTADEL